MTAAFTARRNPIAALAARNERARSLVDAVCPQYAVLTATADNAQRLAAKVGDTVPTIQWPATPEEITAEWLDHEVDRRLGVTDAEMRLKVLRELEYGARTESHTLLYEHLDDFLIALGDQLEDVVVELTDAVAGLGDDVDTAAQAIEAGTADAWKTVTVGLRDYDDIRSVQVGLYAANEGGVDRAAAGDIAGVADTEARLYKHRNLDTIAPDWRPDAAGPSRLPWPSDPAERLVWCIRHDSGIWCPTTAQLSGLAKTVPARNPVDRGHPIDGFKDQSGIQQTPRSAAEQHVVAVQPGPSLWDSPRG